MAALVIGLGCFCFLVGDARMRPRSHAAEEVSEADDPRPADVLRAPSVPLEATRERLDPHEEGIARDGRPAASGLGEVFGLVQRRKSAASADLLAQISASRSYDDCMALLWELEPSPVAGVKVHLTNEGTSLECESNGEGYYRFSGLPPGDHEIAAEALAGAVDATRPERAKASALVHLEGEGTSRRCDLLLIENSVRIRGRVLDVYGTPIAGVLVRGQAVAPKRNDIPVDDQAIAAILGAETDRDGEYLLDGFEPPSLFHAACFLLGIRKASGMQQVRLWIDDQELVTRTDPRVILLPEDLQEAASKLGDALCAMPASVRFPGAQPGREEAIRELCRSEGNTLLDVDLIALPAR